MCGICGAFSGTSGINSFKNGVSLMNKTQVCRGPDDEGIFFDSENNIALGHRRLSIIDLSPLGKGPMSYNNNELQITFNGEIYNFLELKKDLLAQNYKFKTETDTEVILALYHKYDTEAFSKLRGMFAFALWDNKKKKLFLVKDRYGIKPIYYFSDSEKIVFASTVKALKNSGLIEVIDYLEAKISFLLFGSVPLPFTTLKNVFALSPGHYLERDFKGNQKVVKYYDPLQFFESKKEIDFDSAVLDVKNLLEKSIQGHLISDAPLGVFLSGGLDSSAIAALASKDKKPLHTLSIVFEEADFSEKVYQDLVVGRIQSEHQEIKITKNNFLDSYEEIFEAMDQPTIDGVDTFFISKTAREAGLKVVLSGLGADEIFCGYSHFKKAFLMRKIQKMPNFLKTPIKISVIFGERYSKINHFFSSGISNFYLGLRGLFSPYEVSKILDLETKKIFEFIDDYEKTIFSNQELKFLETINPINLTSYLELKFYLQNQLLKDTDFMSMYHSLEVRVPFLDHPLVEFISSLSPEIKLNRKINKHLLVESVRDLLPREILNRSKMGFTFPFQKWLGVQDEHWSRFWAREVFKKWF